jgi:hypothetical protein
MDYASQIREHMPVICSLGHEFGMVDKVEGEYVKLTKDDYGDHHWFPVSWVTKVDKHVHLDRPHDQVMREWKTASPVAAQAWQEGDRNQASAGL